MHFINKINSSKRSWKSQSVSTLRPIANVRRRARCSNKSFLYFQPWTPQSSIAISCVFHQPGSFESPKWSPYINWILYYGSWKKRSDAEIITSFFACLVFLVFVRLLGNQQKKYKYNKYTMPNSYLQPYQYNHCVSPTPELVNEHEAFGMSTYAWPSSSSSFFMQDISAGENVDSCCLLLFWSVCCVNICTHDIKFVKSVAHAQTKRTSCINTNK